MNKTNILEHEMVPEHIILSDEEVEKILKKYNIKKEELPLIRSDDPVVKLIGAEPGQVLKIIRKNSPAGASEYYRLVVEGW
ncbi:MAG: DNA-directed RNA polymerase subunit H [Methanomicrobia archaeon]|nr:DNA-directed RNA polymerase subunit H [Methanomicrobia archaeon]RLF99611.1 MAG: DNA-directed RNA polymerase subunit H [Thermococci archaeon]HDN81734.1 DNA-directed RNA polymerase subunit H [Methanomicrobia archaeon]HHF52015.1 DNA-directed RNA polymerase subunit H [Candidatus Aminicenantes bacterium]